MAKMVWINKPVTVANVRDLRKGQGLGERNGLAVMRGEHGIVAGLCGSFHTPAKHRRAIDAGYVTPSEEWGRILDVCDSAERPDTSPAVPVPGAMPAVPGAETPDLMVHKLKADRSGWTDKLYKLSGLKTGDPYVVPGEPSHRVK
jgi:hypothetical protein